MRVLLLTPDAPVPTHVSGGVTRQYQLHRRLLELGHEVTVVGVLPVGIEDPVAAMRAEGFDFRPYRRPPSRLGEVLRAVVRRPSILRGVLSDPAEDFITRIFWVDLKPLALKALEENGYDVICVECAYASHWLADLETELPRVVTSHEVKSLQFAAKSERSRGLRRLLLRENARRQLRSERRWSVLADAVIAMSDEEVSRWRQAVPNLPPAFAIGNGADISVFDQVGPDPGTANVLFTGTMAYPPNAVAAQWMAREIWPLVKAQEPDAELSIVGRSPGPETLALGEIEGVSVHADVPSMLPFFERAAVCVLPMLEGGGTRLKFAEAMAAGRPVVSTTNGASGVSVENGRQALIADRPEDFSAAVVRLLADPELRHQLGSAGRERARDQYDWRTLGERYAAVLSEVIADQRTANRPLT